MYVTKVHLSCDLCEFPSTREERRDCRVEYQGQILDGWRQMTMVVAEKKSILPQETTDLLMANNAVYGAAYIQSVQEMFPPVTASVLVCPSCGTGPRAATAVWRKLGELADAAIFKDPLPLRPIPFPEILRTTGGNDE